jgi:hypothetical protein
MRCAAVAGLVVFAVGCSDSADVKRYYPAEDKARAALEAALIAWQSGQPSGAVPGAANPSVQFVDSHHAPGRRLKSFEILGLAPGDGPRVFTVKLTLDGPTAEVKTRYVVFGLDPMWVMQHDDYDMLNHWDHPMKSGKGEGKPAS